MNKQEEFARRFATLVDAEVTQYEQRTGKKASDYIRKKYRNMALDKLKTRYPEEVEAVLSFVNYLSSRHDGSKFDGTTYPSWEQTPAEYRPGAEIYGIYRGVLSSRTRYRKNGMDAYRGPKKKNTIMVNGEPAPVSRVDLREPMKYSSPKERYMSLLGNAPSTLADDEQVAILLDVDIERIRQWREEWQLTHRLTQLIDALSPEERQALTELLEIK